jgi:hypothetical protein
LEIIHEQRKSKTFITFIKFIFGNNFLAIANNEGKIYIHDGVDFSFKLTIELNNCNKNSFITSIDYSENLKYLKISTSKNELFYYDFEKNEFIYVISLIKDIKWFYNNSPFSWFTKGFLFY